MKEAGFDTVRLGHLCWDSYEPEDGVYTFEWFDQVMELCVKYKLNVILDVSMHPAPIWVHKLCPGCNVGGKMELHRHRCADIWTMFLIQSIRSMHCGLLKNRFPL